MKLSYIIYSVVAIVFLNILMKFAEKKKKKEKRQQIKWQHQEEPKQKEVQKKFFDEKDKRIREQQLLFQSMVLQEKLKRGQEQQNASLSTKIPKAGESFLANTKIQEEHHQEEVMQHINDRLARRDAATARLCNIALQFDKERELTQDTEQDINFFGEKQHLLNYGIKYLYHMTHKNNLESILKNGLKSHNNIKKERAYVDISNNEVNNRRSKKEPIFNRCVHDYVPLYFNPKNPMLYAKKSIQDDIIILAINTRLLYNNNTLFTNGNAASSTTSFYKDTYDLKNLNWDCINAKYWNSFEDGKRIRCSEILIYPSVEISHIMKIFCNNSFTREFVKHKIDNFANQEINVEIESDLYFDV
ncbi:DUF4433 domain-containing protein [Capnocytophaga sp. ARDL2]|uniref:DUF4433 domain-containing protein n=1 Tax=Capnocytophaga sp. ARDL2 TaxID=3238809 RepID=UPI003557CFE0